MALFTFQRHDGFRQQRALSNRQTQQRQHPQLQQRQRLNIVDVTTSLSFLQYRRHHYVVTQHELRVGRQSDVRATSLRGATHHSGRQMGAPVRVACLASAMTVGAKALVKLTHLARNVNDVLVVAPGRH